MPDLYGCLESVCSNVYQSSLLDKEEFIIQLWSHGLTSQESSRQTTGTTILRAACACSNVDVISEFWDRFRSSTKTQASISITLKQLDPQPLLLLFLYWLALGGSWRISLVWRVDTAVHAFSSQNARLLLGVCRHSSKPTRQFFFLNGNLRRIRISQNHSLFLSMYKMI